jgi:opacity protein-like surface antigen
MPYITGGYASAAFAQRTLVPATGLATDSDRERHSGWFIGLGLDWVVAPSWILGLEYRHYDFDTAFHFAHDVFGNEVASRHTFVDPTLDSVTLRLSWKWDRPEREPPKPLK